MLKSIIQYSLLSMSCQKLVSLFVFEWITQFDRRSSTFEPNQAIKFRKEAVSRQYSGCVGGFRRNHAGESNAPHGTVLEMRPGQDASRPRRVPAWTRPGRDAFRARRILAETRPGRARLGRDASRPGRDSARTDLEAYGLGNLLQKLSSMSFTE